MAANPSEPEATEVLPWYSLSIENKQLPKVLLFGIVGLWIVNLIGLVFLGETQRGTFGDMFGAVNALFSGLAFAGIIYTIALQQKEMKIQSDEFIRQGIEFKRQSDLFSSQNKLMAKESFETSFFNMIVSYEETRRNFSTSISNSMGQMESAVLREHFVPTVPDMRKQYGAFISNRKAYGFDNVLYCFRHASLIIDFIQNSDVADKTFYIEIIVSRLYDEDIKLLFYLSRFDPQPLHAAFVRINLFSPDRMLFLLKQGMYNRAMSVVP
jgi:hypothetical protein